MRTIIVILFLICIGITPCFAGDCPTVTAEVNVVDGFKQYIYTLTNDSDSGAALDIFYLCMPKAAASIVTGFTASQPWKCLPPSTRDIDYCMLRAWATKDADVIVAGQSITFTLTTPASVPTSYTYTVPGYTTNWACNDVGNNILPVPAPVPEPSSIMALAGGIAGLGGLALRRRH